MPLTNPSASTNYFGPLYWFTVPLPSERTLLAAKNEAQNISPNCWVYLANYINVQ